MSPLSRCSDVEAPHERNSKAGVLMTDRVVAQAIRSQCEMLAAIKRWPQVPGL